jgi:phage N-6-adenine-methyltransferase
MVDSDAVTRREGGTDVAHYDPERGLKTIAVAEGGELYWRRAKDPTMLYEAIAAKIKAQAEYVCWRDSVVSAGQPKKNPSGPKIILPDADPGALAAHRWRTRFCLKGETGTIIDQSKMRLALDDAKARALRVVEQEPKGTERGTAGTGEFLRYTPAAYVEACRAVLGTIDLDPASDAQAQQTVKAERFFTVDDDGLAHEWHGNVFLNPPYHRELAPFFVDKLIEELKAGRAAQAIMLTNNSTDTEWFRKAAEAANTVCFTNGRIAFTTPAGIEVAPTQGQAFFYFGQNVGKFVKVFRKIGFGMTAVWTHRPEPAS